MIAPESAEWSHITRVRVWDGGWVQDGGPDDEDSFIYPVQRAEIQDWEQVECVLHHTLYDLLKWEFDNEGNVMMVEPMFTSRKDREAMTQVRPDAAHLNPSSRACLTPRLQFRAVTRLHLRRMLGSAGLLTRPAGVPTKQNSAALCHQLPQAPALRQVHSRAVSLTNCTTH
jgi:hypothetical protein